MASSEKTRWPPRMNKMASSYEQDGLIIWTKWPPINKMASSYEQDGLLVWTRWPHRINKMASSYKQDGLLVWTRWPPMNKMASSHKQNGLLVWAGRPLILAYTSEEVECRLTFLKQNYFNNDSSIVFKSNNIKTLRDTWDLFYFCWST